MRLSSFLSGLIIAGSTSYFFDPRLGTRRRTHLLDRVTHFRVLTQRFIYKRGQELKNRTQGIVADIKATARIEDVPDYILIERVRAELGHAVPHRIARHLKVQSHLGDILLIGDCSPFWADKIQSRVEVVPGVRSVKVDLVEAGLPKLAA